MAIREVLRSSGLLLARLAVAPVFLYTAYRDFGHFGGIAGDLAARGYPAPKVMAFLAIGAKLAGGLSVALGALTPLGCVALVVFVGFATWSFHLPGARAGDAAQTVQLLKNLGLIGALALLAALGPGGASVDRRWLGRRRA